MGGQPVAGRAAGVRVRYFHMKFAKDTMTESAVRGRGLLDQRPAARLSVPAVGLLAATCLFAGSLAACDSGGVPAAPTPIAVHCAGHTLSELDTSEFYQNDPVLPPPVTAVPGVPHQAHTVAAAALPVEDPADHAQGYADRGSGYRIQMLRDVDSQPVWSTVLTVPRSLPKSGHKGLLSSDPDLSLKAHRGYAIATGGTEGDYIGAVSATGQAGPACVLPRLAVADSQVELLPHAGVVVLPNPLEDADSQPGEPGSLDAYSTATSQRLWSVPVTTGGSIPDFTVSGDVVYVWQDLQDTQATNQLPQAVAYDARTGKRLWTSSLATTATALSGGLLGAFGGRVYALYGNNSTDVMHVVALDAANGAAVWRDSIPGSDKTPLNPADAAIIQVGGSDVLLGDSDNGMDYLLSARTGAQLASAAVGKPAAGQNAELQVCYPAGHIAVAVPGNGAIYLLSANPASNRTIPIPPGSQVRVAVTDTQAYVVAGQAGAPVSGYDLATGKLLWTVPVPASVGSEEDVSAFDGGFVVYANSPGAIGIAYS